jgi:hypothetical protein
MNNECGKMIVTGKLFICVMYWDHRKWTIFAWRTVHAGMMDRGFTVLILKDIIISHNDYSF